MTIPEIYKYCLYGLAAGLAIGLSFRSSPEIVTKTITKTEIQYKEKIVEKAVEKIVYRKAKAERLTIKETDGRLIIKETKYSLAIDTQRESLVQQDLNVGVVVNKAEETIQKPAKKYYSVGLGMVCCSTEMDWRNFYVAGSVRLGDSPLLVTGFVTGRLVGGLGLSWEF